jgi:ATP adenylyltransferase
MMIVPFAHVSSPGSAPPGTLEEMTRLLVRCESALRQAYRPTGINLGMNLGRSAGAGIEEHLHLHIVPRWDGDTNFMSVVHGTRVIPESLQATYRRLRPLLVAAVEGPRRSRGRRPERTRRRASGKGR